MSVIAAALKHMLAAGMQHDAIVAAVAEMEAGIQKDEQAERRRAADRERKRAKRPRNSADSADNAEVSHGGVTPVDDKTLTSEIEPQVKKDTPRAALAAVLDDERASAVIEHRSRLRKPLTGHAAKLLAGKFAQCPDPNAAADMMVGNGWQGFEPEWMNRPNVRGSPAANNSPTAQQLLKAQRESFRHDEPAPDRPYLIAAR